MWTRDSLQVEAHFSCSVVADFPGGALTSDAGGLLSRQPDRSFGPLMQLATCSEDFGSQDRCQHSVAQMLAQRVYALAFGYEDLNGHDQLRQDPLLGVLAGKREADQPLAGKSTLSRLELRSAAGADQDRYRKIRYSPEAIDRLLVELFLESYVQPPGQIVLDLDVTDLPLHGR